MLIKLMEVHIRLGLRMGALREMYRVNLRHGMDIKGGKTCGLAA